MKRSFKIPTNIQYGQIAVELEAEQELTDEMILDAQEEFDRALRIIKGGEGLTEDEMNHIADRMFTGESVKGGVELYSRANEAQKYAMQWAKRGIKRINYKLQKDKEN